MQFPHAMFNPANLCGTFGAVAAAPLLAIILRYEMTTIVKLIVTRRIKCRLGTSTPCATNGCNNDEQTGLNSNIAGLTHAILAPPTNSPTAAAATYSIQAAIGCCEYNCWCYNNSDHRRYQSRRSLGSDVIYEGLHYQRQCRSGPSMYLHLQGLHLHHRLHDLHLHLHLS
jgi:hypothetical protein